MSRGTGFTVRYGTNYALPTHKRKGSLTIVVLAPTSKDALVVLLTRKAAFPYLNTNAVPGAHNSLPDAIRLEVATLAYMQRKMSLSVRRREKTRPTESYRAIGGKGQTGNLRIEPRFIARQPSGRKGYGLLAREVSAPQPEPGNLTYVTRVLRNRPVTHYTCSLFLPGACAEHARGSSSRCIIRLSASPIRLVSGSGLQDPHPPY